MSPWLPRSAEAAEDWDGKTISWLASKDGWEVGSSKEVMASEGWGVCRDGRLPGRDREWGCSSSSGCHLGLPGMLGRLKQLSGSPLWQQLKLWLGRRLPILTGPVLRLSRISPSRSSSSPDPRKLLSKASSAHRSGVSSGLGEGVPFPRDSGLSPSRVLLGRTGRFCPKCWVIGSRCCRQSERLVRVGALREPPLCRPESPS